MTGFPVGGGSVLVGACRMRSRLLASAVFAMALGMGVVSFAGPGANRLDATSKELEKKEPAKKDKDSKKKEQKPVNKFCPVEPDNAIDSSVETVTYKGKVVGFCCEDCIKAFKKNPDKYMKNLK